MSLTLRAVDSVELESDVRPGWTFGGGTALALDLNHRISYDIDIFLDSAKVIQNLVPVRNSVTKEICWSERAGQAQYQYPGHYLKLIVEGAGEIDFLAASALLSDATRPLPFEGRIILRERPAEIIAKKIYYRGATCKARDLFDLAGLFLTMPDELVAASASAFLAPDVYSRMRFRIMSRQSRFDEEIRDEVNATDFGASYLPNTCNLALEALALMESEAAQRS